MLRYFIERLKGGGWASFPPLIPKSQAKAVPITVVKTSGWASGRDPVNRHRRAC